MFEDLMSKYSEADVNQKDTKQTTGKQSSQAAHHYLHAGNYM